MEYKCRQMSVDLKDVCENEHNGFMEILFQIILWKYLAC
jgi:hypothetical protein